MRSTCRPPAGSSPTPTQPACERLVFASTCSNYGRMADPTVPITEDGELSPVSLYAEQKVGMEKLILGGGARRRQADVPALRDRLRRRPADALRPDRQRVHARTVGRPRAGSLRRAVLASLHPRARRRARGAHGARGACGEGRRAASSTRAARARTTASSTSCRRSASRSTAAASPTCSRDEDPRDYKVSFDKIRARARLRDADDRARRHRRDHRARSTPAPSAIPFDAPLQATFPERPAPAPIATTDGRNRDLPRAAAVRPAAASRRTSRRSPRRCARAG